MAQFIIGHIITFGITYHFLLVVCSNHVSIVSEIFDFFPYEKPVSRTKKFFLMYAKTFFLRKAKYSFAIRYDTNRDQIVKIARLTGCKNFVGKRKKFIFNAFVDLKPVERFENRSDT